MDWWSDIAPDLDLYRQHRLIGYSLLGIGGVLLLYAVLYNHGTRVFEGWSQSIIYSTQVVVETMTTTGYGAESPWESPFMNGFVILMQLSGIGIDFFTLRRIIIPLFTGMEVNLDNRLSSKEDHVNICVYRRDSAGLLDELKQPRRTGT